jgi:hypothetical protein
VVITLRKYCGQLCLGDRFGDFRFVGEKEDIRADRECVARATLNAPQRSV